ncbi:MAG: ParA family protein [Leptolyngbyaceae cyanobacterium]
MVITAIANQKGGVAKTTSTIAVGGLLAERTNCLVIDLDPQANLTTGLGIQLSKGQLTAYEVLMGQAALQDAVIRTPYNLSLLPSDVTLAQAERQLQSQNGRFLILRELLRQAQLEFDYILIDCPPSLGLLTANALVAADSLLIPVQCQFFALKGLEALLKNVQIVREKLNPQLRMVGVLPTMAEPQTLMTQNTLLALKEKVQAIPVFSPVPKSVKFPESNLAGKPIHLYAREWRLLQPYREVVKALTLLDQ